MAAHSVLGSALPPPVVLRASSFWAPTGRIVEDREYLESWLPKERPQTLGGRDVRWLASGHGDKVVLLERLNSLAVFAVLRLARKTAHKSCGVAASASVA